jgi:hypothetical protein
MTANEYITETEVRLTTFDNPFDPFDDFTSWYMFDEEKGYNTCGYLDRIANVTDDMSQKEADKEIERAIDEIIELNPLNIYRKVSRTFITAY